MENLKVALVHDWLTGQRGGEKVLEALAEIFPEAPIYTLFHFPGSQAEAIERKRHRNELSPEGCPSSAAITAGIFLSTPSPRSCSTSRTTTSSSRARIASPKASSRRPTPSMSRISIRRCAMPGTSTTRILRRGSLSFSPSLFIPPRIHMLRIWDVTSAARVDHFVANSRRGRPPHRKILPASGRSHPSARGHRVFPAAGARTPAKLRPDRLGPRPLQE